MLHSKSRKNGEKSHHPIVALVLFVFAAAFAACENIYASKETEAERIARLRLELLEDSAQEVRNLLGQILSSVHDSLPSDRMVSQYYADSGSFVWVTVDTAQILHRADTVARYLDRQAKAIGFRPDVFLAPQIIADIDHLRKMDFDSTGISAPETLAHLELNLSRGYARYAMGQRYGFCNPHQAFNHSDPRDGGGYRIVYDIDTEQPGDDFVVEALQHARDGHPKAFLDTCEPADKLYQQYIQRLATDTTDEARHRTLCNMERRRWRHSHHIEEGQRHVFVNIAALHLWAIKPDSALSMRICCGAWATKTPLLASDIHLIQVNPEWNIPFSILRNEVARHGGDSAYFARNNYYVVKRSTGEKVSAKSLSPAQIRSGAYRVAQRSGRGNSLGRLIFRFKNQFDVYLHDTNNRKAFNAERRAISHGCVRVERPFDLAQFLLPEADEWLLDKIRLSIDMKPESERGKNYLKEHSADGPTRLVTSVPVTPNIPLEIDYYTLYPNPETGVWETWPDRYEYDKKIIQHIKPFLP